VKTTDELLGILAKLKGEPAPEYIYDENGLGNHAKQKMLDLRAEAWWMEYDDELPEHSAPPNDETRNEK